jgi:hypothetical protein
VSKERKEEDEKKKKERKEENNLILKPSREAEGRRLLCDFETEDMLNSLQYSHFS